LDLLDLAQKYKKVEISNDVLLTIKGVNSGQLKNLEIQSEALELMNNQNKAKQLVLKANEGEVEDEGVKFNDLEIIQDDGEGVFEYYFLLSFSLQTTHLLDRILMSPSQNYENFLITSTQNPRLAQKKRLNFT
jgi:hypothetical protein